MKTTKVINIWVCDNCGQETRYQPSKCLECSKELCSGCVGTFSVEVMSHTPDKVGSLDCISEEYYDDHRFGGAFCPTCHSRISEILLAAGLTKHKNTRPDYRVVLDSAIDQ